MLLFPAAERPADDVRRARGALAAALPAVRAGPPPPAALAGGGAEVLPARRVLLGVLPLRRRRCSTATPARCDLADIAEAIADGTRRSTACCCSASRCSRVGLLFKVGAVPFHSWTPDVYQGAPTAGHRLHGGVHQGRRVRRAAAGVLRRPSAPTAGTGSRCIVGRRDPDHGRSARCSRSPRPTSSGCSPTPRSRTPASSSSACSAFDQRRGVCRGVLFYLVAYGFTTIGAFAVVTLVRDARRRGRRTCRSGPGSAGAPRSWPASSRFFLLPSPASR